MPSEPRERDEDISHYTTLIYGRQGIGKTTYMSSWPDMLMLSCERITRGLSFFDFNWENGGVTSWDVLLKAVELLENSDQFRTVGIDTGEAAYQYCLEHKCREFGVEHPEDMGWGKGWNQVRQEFEGTLRRILATGRGLVISSHSKQQEITSFSGQKYTRITQAASGQAKDVLAALCDLTFYAEHMKDMRGTDIRVLITVGDELVDAKNQLDLPKFLPLTQEGGYDLLCQAAVGEDVGIPAEKLVPSKQTTKTASEMLREQKRTGSSKPAAKKKVRRIRRKRV